MSDSQSATSADSAGLTPSPAAASGPIETTETEAPSLSQRVFSWVESLGTGTENDTMLRFTPSQHNAIDLTEANASGMMQLLGGRRTRLSTLLNEAAAFETGSQAAANLRTKIHEMRQERGIDVGYVAAGIVSWTETTEAGADTFTAPLMLIPVSLRTRDDTNDYEVQFTGPAALNNTLARHLWNAHGLFLDPAEFHRAGYVTARFNSAATADLLTKVTAQVASANPDSPLSSVQVWKQLYVSTFADLTDLGNPHALNTEHPVLQKLAIGGQLDQGAAMRQRADLKPLDERDPDSERLVVEADTDQQAALDAILSGVSAVISTPPGSGQTQTAVNAAAGLAWMGKRVLVVAEHTETLAEFSSRLTAAKLGTLAINVTASAAPEEIRAQVVRAIKRAERTEPPRLSGVQNKLIETRHQLRDHVTSLHKIRERWDCSPYHAMQALAALTSLNPAPGTQVRLRRSVLDNTVDRSHVSVKLKRIAELGEFTVETRSSPWFGAQLSNRQETNDAHTLVKELRTQLPGLRQKVQAACEHVRVSPGHSFADWHHRVLLFQQVQESMGKFSHDVYARDVDDLIAATAPGWWRRQNNVEMNSMARSRLRRVAKEYIRPGGSINDLHSSLVDVQSQREEWMKWAVQDSLPNVPRNLDQLVDYLGAVQKRLQQLVEIVKPFGENNAETLYDVPSEQLVDVVNTLADDERSLYTLPERTLLGEQLREQGFQELLDDLAERQVPAAQVADELELSWWQSALDAMISGDEYLAMTSGENLRTIESQYRQADAAHIESGSQRLSHALAMAWKSAVESHPENAGRLRGLLRESAPTVGALESVSTALTQPLIPIWATSPLGLAGQFSAAAATEPSFDAVIFLDAETLAIPAALGAISRAHQVVAFGDPVSGAPKPMTVSADPIAREAEAQVPKSTYAELATIVPEYQLRQVHRGVDQEVTQLLSRLYSDHQHPIFRLPDAAALTDHKWRFRMEKVSSTAGREPVESPTAEVNRVVDLVFEHIRSHRNRSLAIVTASEWHAKRVADAIQIHLSNHPWAMPFFEHGAAGSPGGSGSGAPGAGAGERFVVTAVDRAHGIVRDDVIFSLGYGHTAHGAAAHDFGEISGPRGREYFVQALTRARGSLTVVASIEAKDLDHSRLDQGAAWIYELLQLDAAKTAHLRASAEVEDPLVLDLVDRIRARGGRVEDGFHGSLDLAAYPRTTPAESQTQPLAMISDGTADYAERSVRERSRLRPEQFERMGWQYMALWTIEVFTDPGEMTERIAERVGLGAGPEFARSGSGRLRRTTGPIHFGGAADSSDENARRPAKQWLAPAQRRVKDERQR